MFLLLLAGFILSVASSKLLSVNPYDENVVTKHYLHLGCILSAKNYSERYESEGVRGKQFSEYHKKCMLAIWPGSNIKTGRGLERRVYDYDSFKRGEILAHHEKGKSLAIEDGFVLSSGARFVDVLYYHKDKPPMNLKSLQKLPWPQDKDLLNFRNVEFEMIPASIREKPPYRPDVTIKLANNLEPISFASFTGLIKALFNMEKYDSVRLGKFRHTLASSFPGIGLFKIHKLGSKTRVVPVRDRFKLILPGDTIACRYDPEVIEPNDPVSTAKYSTTITDFEHKGTTYCLVLTFDILGWKDEGAAVEEDDD